MDIHVISIFPEMFSAITEQGVISRAIKQQVLSVQLHNPRDYAEDKHSKVDARPYGGGPGMVMMPEPMVKVIEAARKAAQADKKAAQADIKAAQADAQKPTKVVYLSPQGRRFDHTSAKEFAKCESLVLLAGRYEGLDQRVIDDHVDEQWSIGDYVLSGGELPAMVMIDAIARLLPDSLGNNESAEQDSFVQGLLDCPHYTRPEQFAGKAVPDVLLSGDHQAIKKWRMKQSLGATWLQRSDLLNKIDLSDAQQRLLDEYKTELTGSN